MPLSCMARTSGCSLHCETQPVGCIWCGRLRGGRDVWKQFCSGRENCRLDFLSAETALPRLSICFLGARRPSLAVVHLFGKWMKMYVLVSERVFLS